MIEVYFPCNIVQRGLAHSVGRDAHGEWHHSAGDGHRAGAGGDKAMECARFEQCIERAEEIGGAANHIHTQIKRRGHLISVLL